MKLTFAPVPGTTRPTAPTAFSGPTPAFRKRAWTSFQASIDPLGTARPLRQVDSRI